MIKKLTLLYKGVFGKLLLTYILFSIIPASLIGWVSFQVSEKLLEAHITQSHSNTLDQIEKNISVLLDQVIAIVNIYNMNNEVEPYLSKHYDNFYDELHDKAIVEKKMLTYSFTFDWLHFQSYLIGDNDLIYSQNHENGNIDVQSLSKSFWYDALSKNPDQITWMMLTIT